jgi:DnaJ-domain-containing protein 1
MCGMSMPAFDTARFQDTLSEGGFTPVQAKSLLRAVSDVTDHLPSSDTLAAFKSDVRAEIAAVRSELSKSLSDQTWKMAQMVFAAVLLNAAVVAGVGLAVYNAVKP